LKKADIMRDFARRAVAAAVSAIALGGAGISSAAAADFSVPQVQQPAPPGYYGDAQEYYGAPPVVPGYAYPLPPPVYAYPPAPAYGYYAPGPVVVVPGPYYRRPFYGPLYGPVYGVRRYGPAIARGYGPYGYGWGRYR
jgi:hypothetical protein